MRVAGWPEREIGAIAARQRALVTRAQLSALGVTRAAIDHAIVRGRLHRCHHAVLWRDEKVIVELDGYDYHRGRAAFERDHQRDAEHQRMDHLVIRITGRQLARELEALLVQITTALAVRTAA